MYGDRCAELAVSPCCIAAGFSPVKKLKQHHVLTLEIMIFKMYMLPLKMWTKVLAGAALFGTHE